MARQSSSREIQNKYIALSMRHLGRKPSAADGFSKRALATASKRLDVVIPRAVGIFYELLGKNKRIALAHNRLLSPTEMFVEHGCVLFMEENQLVVHWGIKLSALNEVDPVVWQVVNSDASATYSEKLVFSEFIVRMLDWQAGFASESTETS